jgi:predicted outer membrane repeat protein
LTLENVVIARNVCNGNAGGGMSIHGSVATFTDCLFEANTGPTHGGGLNSWESTIGLDSCTFTGNEAEHGGAISTGPDGYVALITSCSFIGNTPDDVCGPYVSGDIRYDSITPDRGDVFDLVTLTGDGFGAAATERRRPAGRGDSPA